MILLKFLAFKKHVKKTVGFRDTFLCKFITTFLESFFKSKIPRSYKREVESDTFNFIKKED